MAQEEAELTPEEWRRAKELFDALLELSEGERNEFVSVAQRRASDFECTLERCPSIVVFSECVPSQTDVVGGGPDAWMVGSVGGELHLQRPLVEL